MRTCTLAFAGRTGSAQWSLEGDRLTLLPAAGTPLPVALVEVSGLSGDGYSLDLRLGGAALSLSKLGAEGPTLKEQLERTWPPLRSGALRLAGTGAPARFAGHLDLGAGAAPALLLLFEDLLVAFREGEDARPLFLSLQREVRHDEETYSVALEGWDGTTARFTRLGGATGAFVGALTAARGALVQEASEALGAGLPSLATLPRTLLASVWTPGRLLSATALDAVAPGTSAALAASWSAVCPRGREGTVLLEGAQPEESFFAYTRPGAGGEPSGETEAEGPAETAAEPEGNGPSPALPEGLWPLWLLVRRGGVWYLESLGETDRATYRFAGGDEVPALCAALLCAPQFSREALYQPLERLVGGKAGFALPARDLPFLKELRARFKGRVLHTSPSAWRKGIG